MMHGGTSASPHTFFILLFDRLSIRRMRRGTQYSPPYPREATHRIYQLLKKIILKNIIYVVFQKMFLELKKTFFETCIFKAYT